MRGRLSQLDILRGVAIILVIGYHLPIPANSVPYWLLPIKKIGWSGVDLFFVLSGFLISGLLLREYQKYCSIDFLRFYVRRGLKIYPAFYVFLLITVLIGRMAGIAGNLGVPSWTNAARESLFIQNYFFGIWGNTWSLAVEEHFYALLGIFVFCLIRLRPASKNAFSAIVPLFICVASACLLIRFSRSCWQWPNYPRNQFLTHLRIDSLLFGVLLSYLYNFHAVKLERWVNKRRRFLIIFSTLLLVPFLILDSESFFVQTLGFTMLYLSYGGILLVSVLGSSEQRNKLFAAPLSVLSTIGRYSYSIYLWHTTLLFWGPILFTSAANILRPHLLWWNIAILAGASIGVGIAMAKIVEMPFLALRDRLYPSRSGALSKLKADVTEPAIEAAVATFPRSPYTPHH